MEDTYIYAISTVFLIAASPTLEIWLAIPAGLALGLDPITTASVALLGNAIPVILIIIFYKRISEWLRSRSNGRSKEPGRARRRFDALWSRYGLPVVALTAPITVGTHMVALIVMAAGTRASQAIAWIVFGLVVWAVLFTLIMEFGITFLTG